MSFAWSCREQLNTSKLTSLAGKLLLFKNCVLEKASFKTTAVENYFTFTAYHTDLLATLLSKASLETL